MSIEQRNKALVENFFGALNRGDSAAIVEAYAEDGRCVTMGRTLISGTFSRAQIAQAAGSIFQVFPQGSLAATGILRVNHGALTPGAARGRRGERLQPR